MGTKTAERWRRRRGRRRWAGPAMGPQRKMHRKGQITIQEKMLLMLRRAKPQRPFCTPSPPPPLPPPRAYKEVHGKQEPSLALGCSSNDIKA